MPTRLSITLIVALVLIGCEQGRDSVSPQVDMISNGYTVTSTDLGTLGGNCSAATAVNPAGDVVGWSTTATSRFDHAVLWKNGSGIDLGTLGGLFSVAYAINSHGQIVGEADAADLLGKAFLWQDGAMQNLGTLGGQTSQAFSINNAGQVVGVSETSGSNEAFLWENGQMTGLGTLFPGGQSMAYAINDRGQVAGVANTNIGGWHSVMWDHGQIVDLGILAQGEGATAINNSGYVVGGVDSNSLLQAYAWYQGAFRLLGPDGLFSFAWAINDRGDVAGSAYLPQDPHQFHAVLWRDGTLVDLGRGPSVGSYNVASGLNNRGVVVGQLECRATMWMVGK